MRGAKVGGSEREEVDGLAGEGNCDRDRESGRKRKSAGERQSVGAQGNAAESVGDPAG